MLIIYFYFIIKTVLVLDEVKKIEIENSMQPTLSMGIGDAETIQKSEEYAKASLDMALGRGGDQAVVKDGDRTYYYGGKSKQGEKNANSRKGIILAIVAGLLMSTFYRFVVKGMDINNFEQPAEGMLTPYSAIFIFSLGVLVSNLVFNTYVMKRPFVGTPVSYSEYFKGSLSTHLVGVLGGAIWCLGTAFSYIAAGKAGAAVSYALGQGAPMIAAFWGVFIWHEFKGADRKTGYLLALMFALFIIGLSIIVVAGN